MKSADRDAWAAYVEAQGLLRRPTVAVPALDETPTRTKYGNTRVEIDGITFDSKKESARYLELKLMQSVGQIAELELQPKFPLHIMALWRSGIEIRVITVGTFTADFRYVDLHDVVGEIVIEDVKSPFTKTTAYHLRKRIAEAVHGVVIREV